MNKFLFYLIQFTWGIIQNLLGFFVFMFIIIFMGGKIKPRYKNAFICEAVRLKGGVSLGCFIVVNNANDNFTLNHEYGHTLQSLILGVFYLFVIGLPSLIWAAFFEEYRNKNKINYYSFYTEKWANKLAGKKYDSQWYEKKVIETKIR